MSWVIEGNHETIGSRHNLRTSRKPASLGTGITILPGLSVGTDHDMVHDVTSRGMPMDELDADKLGMRARDVRKPLAQRDSAA